MPLTHIKKNVPSGIKPTEKKPLPKQKLCMKGYRDYKKRLTGRTPIDLTKAEIKGRDDRPTIRIALSIDIMDKAI